MTQRAFEAALGRLICDDAFRREFDEDAEGAIAREGFFLTPTELTSLHKIGIDVLEEFAHHVDDRVRRADLTRELERGRVQRPTGSLKQRSKRSGGAS